MSDMVNHPSHYTHGGIETIDYMEAKSTNEEFCGHLRLTAIKYLSRTGLKDDELQDLEKAAWYLNRLILKKKAMQDEKRKRMSAQLQEAIDEYNRSI
jgi:hypothetical protein